MLMFMLIRRSSITHSPVLRRIAPLTRNVELRKSSYTNEVTPTLATVVTTPASSSLCIVATIMYRITLHGSLT